MVRPVTGAVTAAEVESKVKTEVSSKMSMALMKNLVRASVSEGLYTVAKLRFFSHHSSITPFCGAVCYLRALFPEDCFQETSFAGEDADTL
jgi:hypothetical protein